MASRVRLLSRGMRDLLASPEVREALTQKAEAVADTARASAPVASGAYRDSIRVEQDTTDRAAVRVIADVPHALIVEANTGTLARALDAAR